MRRSSAIAVAAALAVGGLTPSQASAAPVANWPQERGGAPHRGWNQDETTLAAGNVAGLQPGWGGRSISNSSVRFEPIVVGSTVYFVKNDDDYGARIEAKDVATATSIWWWSRNGDPMSPPISANGKLYWLVTGWPDGRPINDGQRSMLYALDPATGSVIWKADTAGHATSTHDQPVGQRSHALHLLERAERQGHQGRHVRRPRSGRDDTGFHRR
jgi:outer membrane protein assembly factor BamB